MFEPSLSTVLDGGQALLGLFFSLAALYFGWVLSRIHPGRAANAFFWSVAAALAVQGILMLAVLAFSLSAFLPGADMLGFWLVRWDVLISFAEAIAWLAASVSLWRWAAIQKRQRVGTGA